MGEPAGFSRTRGTGNKSSRPKVTFDTVTLNKARWCRRKLLSWYDLHGREFPWRSPSASVYQKVVTEILLQRTQASTASQIFVSFFRMFQSWDDIDATAVGQLEQVLQPIGLWRRRATALKALAREMVARGGSFPSTRDELEALPAVGQYVASSVLLFEFGRAEPLLDGNMARVIERVFAPRRLVDIRYDPELQALARILVRSRNPARVNWATLDLAAQHCLARTPKCGTCPLKRRCSYTKGADVVDQK